MTEPTPRGGILRNFWPAFESDEREVIIPISPKAPEFTPEELADATLLGLLTCAFGPESTFEPLYVLRGYLDAVGLSEALETPLSVLRERLTFGERAQAMVAQHTYPFPAHGAPESFLDGWDAAVEWLGASGSPEEGGQQ